jgi:hypothetical protein
MWKFKMGFLAAVSGFEKSKTCNHLRGAIDFRLCRVKNRSQPSGASNSSPKQTVKIERPV